MSDVKIDERSAVDLIEVLINLHHAIDALPGRVAAALRPPEPTPKAAEEKPATWTQRATAFLATQEARDLAAAQALTAEIIAAKAGLEASALGNGKGGRRNRIGRLTKQAGYGALSIDNGPTVYILRGATARP